MRNLWRDNRGNIIPTIMIILVVGSLLAAALAVLGDTDMRILSSNQRQQQARYLARTGAEAALQVYQKDVEALHPGNTDPMTTDTVYLKKDGSYTKDSSEPDIVGHCPVEVEMAKRDIGGGVEVDEVRFTSNAVYDGMPATQVVGAYPTLNAKEAGWYDDNGVVLKSKLLNQEQAKAAYNIGGGMEFNPKLNGISLVPVPDTTYNAQ
ncbi:MAG: hypothetical protein LBH21_02950, partial [Gracilibacteraceae bacterium]|nr:hypothetical protein [Gracilibacteraceae bacterium]